MLEPSSRQRVGTAAFAFLLATALPASAAPDPIAVADAIVAATAATGRAEASYDSASASGDTITISNYKAKRPSGDTVLIPSLVIDGAALRDGGGFTADSVAFDAGKLTRGNDSVTWATGAMREVTVPSPQELTAETDLKPFAGLDMGDLVVSESNLAEPVTIASLSVRTEGEHGAPRAFAAEINGVHVRTSALDKRPREKAVLDALGYDEFNTDITLTGAFDPPNQAMTIDAFTIDTADVGTLTVTARLTGVSPGELATRDNTAAARDRARLESLAVRFENDGVVERALDIQAAVLGMDRKQFAEQVATTLLPLALGFIGNKEFEAKLATAIGDFLADPQSITFSAEPATPVPVEQVLNTGITRPSELPALLDADVSAN